MPEDGLMPDKTAFPGTDMTDARVLARLRLLLALLVLVAIQIEPWGLPGMDPARWPVFVAYGLYSLAVDRAAQAGRGWAQARWLHWMDVLWAAQMVLLTGGTSSVMGLFFFFAIVCASFGWGRREGTRVTLGSGLAFALAGGLPPPPAEPAQMMLRTGLLLGLGGLCVYWGHAQVQLKRRLALLRDVSQLSNPRFGAERTLQQVLARTSRFFGASTCLLVLRGAEDSQVWMRRVQASDTESGAMKGGTAQTLPTPMDQLLLSLDAPPDPGADPFGADRPVMLHIGGGRWRRSRTECFSEGRWQSARTAQARQASDICGWLEQRHFMSVPVNLRQGQGRLYVCSQGPAPGRDEAAFLAQLVAQAFAVIDHIDLLDRMASDAARRERQKMALDLHDTAVQPYIGLKLGLAALCQKAAPDNPLHAELHKLQAMACRVTEDLRRFARQVRQPLAGEPALLTELRQHAGRMREFYGVDIAVEVEGELSVNDRLSAEVLQVVREGLSNICRHTQARRGQVRLSCRSGWLGICIANEGTPPGTVAAFTPRSISERAAALGGRAHVQHDDRGSTAVHILIPV